MPDWQFGNEEFQVTSFNPISSFLNSPTGTNRGIPSQTCLRPLCLCPHDTGLMSPVLTQRPMRSQFQNQFGNKCSLWHWRVDFPDYTQQTAVQGSRNLWPACGQRVGVGWKDGGCWERSWSLAGNRKRLSVNMTVSWVAGTPFEKHFPCAYSLNDGDLLWTVRRVYSRRRDGGGSIAACTWLVPQTVLLGILYLCPLDTNELITLSIITSSQV